MLLLWAPAKPAAKAGSNRAELAVLAAQEYAAKFDEILSRAVEGAPEVDPPLTLHSWRCFLARWVGALSAAAEGNTSAQGQVIFHRDHCRQAYTLLAATSAKVSWEAPYRAKVAFHGTACLAFAAGPPFACPESEYLQEVLKFVCLSAFRKPGNTPMLKCGLP